MSEWLPAAPAFLAAVAIVLVPGLAAAYAVGVRGVAAWGVAPSLGLTVITAAAVLAPVMHLSWAPWLPLVATVAAGLIAFGLGLLVRPQVPQRPTGRPSRRPGDPLRTRWFATAGICVGGFLVLAAAVPGIGTPDELVDSTDVVAHLNRIRRFLDTGVFSSLGSADHPAYPSGFHDLAATLAQVVPALTPGRGVITAANLTALAVSAVVWPLGVVALARLALGRSGAVLIGAGVASAAVTSFPYVLMGWGVLWPNLLGTALLPGVLGPALVATGVVAPVPGLPRRLATVTAVAALPGLTLSHPNALVSLVLFVVLAVATPLALRARRAGDVAVRRSATVALVGTVAGSLLVLVLAPRVSRQIADTASYDWGAHEGLGPSLRDVVLLGLQTDRLPWGLVLLMGVGAVVCVRRVRLGWVAVTWVAVVLLFLVAATGRPGWGSLVTGYWYNDKVRLGALVAVPAALLATVGVQTLARGIARLLEAFTPVGSQRSRRPWALAFSSTAGAVVLLLTVTVGANHEGATDLVDRYYHPDQPTHVLLDAREDADLGQLAALIPPDVVTADVPANGSSLLYALHGRKVLFDSLLLDPDADHALIGLHLNEAATRSDVCDALRRENVRYAVTGRVRYWLSLNDRTRGMAALGGTVGFEQVGAAGRYRLYRIQACGFDPSWLPPS